ncbi:hypothetical protein [Alkalihalobacillus sp. LMS39]|uniref:hypothetical protein n=1 Tax=Alkalihalobacillus sp. LMS39 TaxID=2924032 RepID=UPI001FB563CF|nr:hypothetical protein [Alkalihalobacillus sp. LMS39]UOE96090.1 hypothetical protein MM271_11020 [Alkalihalobacillus sp. LMS39]
MKTLSKFALIIGVLLVGLGVMLPNQVSANTAQCKMTIVSDRHTGFDKPANSDGECRDLVYGFYNASSKQFQIYGYVTHVVSRSGEQFTIYPPTGSTEAVLTVTTVLNAEPKPEPEPKPKPKPEPEPKPEPKPQPEPKPEPKTNNNNNSNNTTKTSASSSSSITSSKNSNSNQSASSNSVEPNEQSKPTTTVKPEEKPIEEVKEDVEFEEEVEEEIENEVEEKELDEVIEKDVELLDSKTTKKSSLSLLFIIFTLVVVSSGIGGYVLFRKSKKLL